MVLKNHLRAGAFLLSEGPRFYSRDEVVVASGAGNLKAGTVLAKLTSGGEYVPAVYSAGDGSQTAIAVLYDDVDATSAAQPATVISRLAEVHAADLFYDDSISDADKVAAKEVQLLAVGIVVRGGRSPSVDSFDTIDTVDTL